MTRYKVHVGTTATGRNRWRRFPTFDTAKAFCERIWQATGVVLTIVEAA